MSVEEQLEVIDGGAGSQSDYRAALNRLEEKCTNPRRKLSDMAVRSQQLLAEDGQDESVLSILRNVAIAIPDEYPRGDCTEIYATWLALMTQ